MPLINNHLYPLKQKQKTKNMLRQPTGAEKTIQKKLKERPLKDNQEMQMTLKELIDSFQPGLNDPASILMAIEETMGIMKEEHNTKINISIGSIHLP